MSFLSFVYPGSKWSLALYRHQLADFSVATEINGLFSDVPEGGTLRYEDQYVITSLEIDGTGLAGAYQLSDRVEYSIIAETLNSPLVDTSVATIDDANELHLGAEYLFLKTSPLIAIRCGIWHDPDHRFRYLGDDPFSQAIYRQGEDLLHVTAGVGIVFKRFQIDLGADLSQNSTVVALSAIYSF